MRSTCEKDAVTNHERALRTLSIEHRLHIGVATPRPGVDDGSQHLPEAPRRGEALPALTLRTLLRYAAGRPWRRRGPRRSGGPLGHDLP